MLNCQIGRQSRGQGCELRYEPLRNDHNDPHFIRFWYLGLKQNLLRSKGQRITVQIPRYTLSRRRPS